MIRVVLDTNVVVSALISPRGNPAQVLEAVRCRQLVPCISKEIFQEYADVLKRPKFGFQEEQIIGLQSLMLANGLLVLPTPRPANSLPLSPDKDDEVFILCARAADAEFLVTGNLRHFPAESCGRTTVVTALGLVEVLRMRGYR